MNASETLAAVGWLIGVPCVSGQVTASWPLFSALTAGLLQAGWSSLCWQPGDCKSASFLCVDSDATTNWLVTVNQQCLPCVTDGVAARRLAVAVCTPDKLSQCKRSCD
jgi:hypothetical protein